MPTRSSNGRSLVAAASFVFALAAAVGPASRQASAQPTKAPSNASKQENKDTKKSGDDAETSDETEKEAAEKKAAEKKAADQTNAEKTDGMLDPSVESPKAIYVSGDLAATRTDLGGLSDDTGFDRTVANGLSYGLGAGLRLRDLRLGARWRVYDTTEFTLWSFALQAGYGLPLRPISPVFSAHVGYVFDQILQQGLFRRSLPVGTILPPDVDVKGLIAGIDVNASYWVTRFVRLGLFIGADALFLNRAQVAVPRSIVGNTPELSQNPLYAGSGSSIGLNFNIGLRGAFDIAFK